jgi:general secretion pathway protein L
MTADRLDKARQAVLQWIDSVVDVVVGIQDSLAEARDIRLVEEADHSFTLVDASARTTAGARAKHVRLTESGIVDSAGAGVQDELAGARIRLTLAPDHFVIRDLELPAKATEFMQGVIRAQIDRLTPWTAAQAMFGYRTEGAVEGDRIRVTIAATARAVIDRFVQAFARVDAHSVAVAAAVPHDGRDAAPIDIVNHRLQSARNRDKARRVLVIAGVAALLFAGLAAAGSSLAGAWLAAQTDTIEAQIANARRNLQAGPVAAGSAAALHRQKAAMPLATLVIETLSRILPDDVYLTDLDMHGDTLHIVGLARNAPDVIRIIEASPTFAQASFAAPTVRSANDGSEHFQIEAHINPVYPVKP